MEENQITHADYDHKNSFNIDEMLVRKCIKSEPKTERDEKKSIKIRICMFFDGTLNNRRNVEIGAEKRNHYSDGNNKTDGSYDNDPTNIDKLEKLWLKDKKVDLSFSVYVEGVGTLNEKEDNYLVAALGTGNTGLLAKVEVGMTQIILNVVSKAPSKIVDSIYLDAFGFSRGAAAARNFIYSALANEGNTLKDRLSAVGFIVNTVEIIFVGLFDTVASYAVVYRDDTTQLHLDSIRHAERVVQLVAADEHRANFRLTNINSAKNRLQVFLPGTHSDIGGGYRDDMEEDFTIYYYQTPHKHNQTYCATNDDLNAIERERNWLIDSGWYLKDQIKDVYNPFYDSCALKVERRNIKNSYDRIPLKIMANLAREAGVYFGKLSGKYAVPTELTDVEEILNKYISALSDIHSHPNDWFENNLSAIKTLKNRYLHFSSQYFIALGAYEPQFTGGNAKSGQRERIIQNG